MAFLTLDGVPVPVFHDEMVEEYVDIGGEPERGVTGAVAAARTAILRQWSFRTPPIARALFDFYLAWINGHGGTWRWDFATKISEQGYTNSVAGTFALNPGAGPGAPGAPNTLTVSSGSVFGWNPRYRMGVQRPGGWTPSMGWTICCQRPDIDGFPGSGFHPLIFTGTADFARNASSGNPANTRQYRDAISSAAGSYGLGNIFSVSASSPYVGLHGYNATNSAVASDFADFCFFPFELPTALTHRGTTFQEELLTFMASTKGGPRFGRRPILNAHGDYFNLAATDYVPVVGRARRSTQMSTEAGELRQLECTLTETMEVA